VVVSQRVYVRSTRHRSAEVVVDSS
jgi:hypothetical protein